MLFLSRCCQAGGHSHGLSHGMVSWPLAWFSEGCMSAAVHDVLLSDTLIKIFGSSFAAIVTIEGSPEHVPFCFRVLSALQSAVYRACVHLHHEFLELIALDDAIAFAVDLVPRIVHFFLECFSVCGAAFFVRDAQRCLERLLCLSLSLSEGLLPLPDVVLQRCE